MRAFALSQLVPWGSVPPPEKKRVAEADLEWFAGGLRTRLPLA